ncbi:Uncharacterised protein [Mycobacteroides abscessus subsp. abscessus]|nr:Uncharacterised protein [Mycobacteroides abscessus subsp. abscessus]
MYIKRTHFYLFFLEPISELFKRFCIKINNGVVDPCICIMERQISFTASLYKKDGRHPFGFKCQHGSFFPMKVNRDTEYFSVERYGSFKI